jgi:Holliday junction resolvasome RuvABC endonuclease subunit
MRIFAIDPGTNKIGISLLENDKLLWINEIELGSFDLYVRYSIICSIIDEILEKNTKKIDYYAIETPFFSRNVSTAIKLGTVRGIIMGCIFRKHPDAKIVDVSPLDVRRHFGVKKSSDKEVIHSYLKKLFGDKITESKEDALDSVAIGLASTVKIKDIIRNGK